MKKPYVPPLDRLYPKIVARARLDNEQRAWLDRQFAALRAMPVSERRAFRGDPNDRVEPNFKLLLVWGVISVAMSDPHAVILMMLVPIGLLVAIAVQLSHVFGV